MLLNAQFVWRELPIRYAHRVKQLRSLQFGLNECEQIQKAADSYTAHAQQMHDRPKPVDAETKASFDQLLRDTQPALLMVPGLIGEALAQRKLPESDKQVRAGANCALPLGSAPRAPLRSPPAPACSAQVLLAQRRESPMPSTQSPQPDTLGSIEAPGMHCGHPTRLPTGSAPRLP